jgi:hypothetical protein
MHHQALLQSDWNTSPSQIGTPIFFAVLLLLLHCCFSTRLLTSLVRLHVPAASRWTKTIISNFSQCFIARNTPEEDEKSAAAQSAVAAAALAAAAIAEAAEVAEAACCCKLEQTSLQS